MTLRELIEKQPLLLDVSIELFNKKVEQFLNQQFSKEWNSTKTKIRNCGSCDKYERGCVGNVFNMCDGWIERK
jgi:hypothetical protein